MQWALRGLERSCLCLRCMGGIWGPPSMRLPADIPSTHPCPSGHVARPPTRTDMVEREEFSKCDTCTLVGFYSMLLSLICAQNISFVWFCCGNTAVVCLSSSFVAVVDTLLFNGGSLRILLDLRSSTGGCPPFMKRRKRLKKKRGKTKTKNCPPRFMMKGLMTMGSPHSYRLLHLCDLLSPFRLNEEYKERQWVAGLVCGHLQIRPCCDRDISRTHFIPITQHMWGCLSPPTSPSTPGVICSPRLIAPG